MNLLNDLTHISNINPNISKSTQTHIKFFIKSGKCLTPVKRGTSAMHHNHHHIITGLKDDYCTKELNLQIGSTGKYNHNVPKQNPTKPPKTTQCFQTLGVKQISPKLPYQPFIQYSNQHIRHQQINLQTNKHQLTNSPN
jgi:hypothetical protein